MQFTEISFRNPKLRQKSSLSETIKAETQLPERCKIIGFSNEIPETGKHLAVAKPRSGRLFRSYLA